MRFETRSSGPGQARTFAGEDPALTRTNPVDSLDWPDFLAELNRSQSTS